MNITNNARALSLLIVGIGMAQELASVSAPVQTASEIPSNEIKQLVKDLEYPDEVARDFVQMVSGWKDARGGPILAVLKKQLKQAKQDSQQGKISKDQLARVEEDAAKQLAQRIKEEIGDDVKCFDLSNVVKNKQAQCLGYTQLFYILGNSIGLSVEAVQVLDTRLESRYRFQASGKVADSGHVACLNYLTNDKVVMVDLAVEIQNMPQAPTPLISKSFNLEREFKKVGNYWELKDNNNTLTIHGRIQIQDKAGLVAYTYVNRAATYEDLGKHTEALSGYTKAIALNPKLALAYFDRGHAYDSVGKYTEALADYTKAIELDPKDARAYCNRGTVHLALRNETEAVSDCSNAIKRDPTLGEAYGNRGVAYLRLGKHRQALSDCTKAIELNPQLAAAYNNRGNAYFSLGKHKEALADYSKAIELDPNDAEVYYNRGKAHMGLHSGIEALVDYNDAIKLNPRFAAAYFSRGLLYAAAEIPEDAKTDLLKAVELDPALKPRVKKASDEFKLGF